MRQKDTRRARVIEVDMREQDVLDFLWLMASRTNRGKQSLCRDR
jgi:hypothetical protein